jgi:hypothetical protein
VSHSSIRAAYPYPYWWHPAATRPNAAGSRRFRDLVLQVVVGAPQVVVGSFDPITHCRPQVSHVRVIGGSRETDRRPSHNVEYVTSKNGLRRGYAPCVFVSSSTTGSGSSSYRRSVPSWFATASVLPFGERSRSKPGARCLNFSMWNATG